MYHVIIDRSADSAIVSDNDVKEVQAALIVCLKEIFGITEDEITMEAKYRSPLDILRGEIGVCVIIDSKKVSSAMRDSQLRMLNGELERTLPERLTGKDKVAVTVVLADVLLWKVL
jgi:hypothetical protein